MGVSSSESCLEAVDLSLWVMTFCGHVSYVQTKYGTYEHTGISPTSLFLVDHRFTSSSANAKCVQSNVKNSCHSVLFLRFSI